MLAVLGRSWVFVGGLGPLLGPMFAVLAALGASVGGPGLSWTEKRPKPERESDPKSHEAEVAEAPRSHRGKFISRYRGSGGIWLYTGGRGGI